MKILVVEDDAALREMLEEMLDLHGYEVRSESNGRDGLRAVAEFVPDLILCDITMPIMDGYAMLEALRRDPDGRTIPVIMLTARVERQSVRQGMNLGADDYLTKPFNEKELLQSITTRLERKALVDELDDFAHTVAHGLKNPLTPILGSASLLAAAWPQLDEPTRTRSLHQIVEGARRMKSIIEELLLLASVRKSPVTPVPLDMTAIVQEALDRTRHLAEEHQARVELPAEWPPAVGHAPWVVEIWANYLGNAITYGGRPPQLVLGAEPAPNGRSRFWVRDNGAGLTPEQQSRLFLPCSRLNRTDLLGHGLGLSIVRRIAEKLGGTCGVTSQPGAGSQFQFTLRAEVPVPDPDDLAAGP